MTAIAPVITIDGPSGAGKGTLCKAMAEALQWLSLIHISEPTRH